MPSGTGAPHQGQPGRVCVVGCWLGWVFAGHTWVPGPSLLKHPKGRFQLQRQRWAKMWAKGKVLCADVTGCASAYTGCGSGPADAPFGDHKLAVIMHWRFWSAVRGTCMDQGRFMACRLQSLLSCSVLSGQVSLTDGFVLLSGSKHPSSALHHRETAGGAWPWIREQGGRHWEESSREPVLGSTGPVMPDCLEVRKTHRALSQTSPEQRPGSTALLLRAHRYVHEDAPHVISPGHSSLQPSGTFPLSSATGPLSFPSLPACTALPCPSLTGHVTPHSTARVCRSACRKTSPPTLKQPAAKVLHVSQPVKFSSQEGVKHEILVWEVRAAVLRGEGQPQAFSKHTLSLALANPLLFPAQTPSPGAIEKRWSPYRRG